VSIVAIFLFLFLLVVSVSFVELGGGGLVGFVGGRVVVWGMGGEGVLEVGVGVGVEVGRGRWCS
jgi:hypothetical protein